MNAYTGEIMPLNDIPAGIKSHFVPVERDLSLLERYNKQVNLYSECVCGSGKKFKFCCHRKVE